jgi:hypothetical protein
MGDFNAKVRKNSFAPNVGQYSLHEKTNDNGWRMRDFTVARGMVVSRTLFQHKSIHLQTWRSPDGLSANQINHVMIDSRHATDIMDVRSCRGADCDSDHYMVKMKLRQRIAAIGKKKRQKNIKYNTDKLQMCPLHGNIKRKQKEYLGKSDIGGRTMKSTWMCFNS